LVALHDLAALHHALIGGAIELSLDAGVVVAMQHVKAHPRAARARVQPHRQRDEAESQISRPDGSRHGTLLLGLGELSCKMRRALSLWPASYAVILSEGPEPPSRAALCAGRGGRAPARTHLRGKPESKDLGFRALTCRTPSR